MATSELERTCPKCQARPGEPCRTGGYLPVGDLPGDPLIDGQGRPRTHRERRVRACPSLPPPIGGTCPACGDIDPNPLLEAYQSLLAELQRTLQAGVKSGRQRRRYQATVRDLQTTLIPEARARVTEVLRRHL